MGIKLIGRKKGQLGLVDIFSMLLYFVAVFILILLLNLGGCLIKNKEARAAIEADVSLATYVRADAQLNSYLRTAIPEKAELDKKMEWLEKNPNPQFSKQLKSLKIDFGKANGFLSKYPEVYANQDYSGFIGGLHTIHSTGGKSEKEGAEQAFKAVTAALFLRAVEDYPKKGEYLFYLLPLSVDFDPSDFGPSTKENMCEVSYELCAQYLPQEVVPSPILMKGVYISPTRFSSQSVQAFPLADLSVAKIEFRYYPELKSKLPQP